MLKKTAGILSGLLLAAVAHAAEPKIAVTDLTYEEKVSQYFRVVAASNKSSVNASESYRERDSDYSSSASGRSKLNAKSESKYLFKTRYFSMFICFYPIKRLNSLSV